MANMNDKEYRALFKLTGTRIEGLNKEQRAWALRNLEAWVEETAKHDKELADALDEQKRQRTHQEGLVRDTAAAMG